MKISRFDPVPAKSFSISFYGFILYFTNLNKASFRFGHPGAYMKIRVKVVLFVAMLALLAVRLPALGQDASVQEYDVSNAERDRLERDRIINSPGEGELRYMPRAPITQSTATPAVKDTATSKPVMVVPQTRARVDQPAKQPEKPMNAREDESILSFNFLYYIIQKYKLQDFVD